MATDFVWVGRIKEAKHDSGVRKDGSTWEQTRILFLKPSKDKDGNVVERSFWLTAWAHFDIREMETYSVHCNVGRRKRKDSDEYEWTVDVIYILPYGRDPLEDMKPEPKKEEAPKSSAPQPSMGYAKPQSQGFSRQTFRQEQPQPSADYSKEQGPEFFNDSDIPF